MKVKGSDTSTAESRSEVRIITLCLTIMKEEENEVNHVLSNNASRRKVLVTHENSNIEITGELLRCLRPGAWLNDEVINLYLQHILLQEGGISQTTSNTTSSGGSNVSGKSHFSASSGGSEVYPSGQILSTPNLRVFTYAELMIATKNLREKEADCYCDNGFKTEESIVEAGDYPFIYQ